MQYNKGMAALVSAIRPGKPDSPLTVVTHEVPWYCIGKTKIPIKNT
jgi:hypothetical protein